MRKQRLATLFTGLAIALTAAAPSFAQYPQYRRDDRVDERQRDRNYRDERDRDRDRGDAREYHQYTREGSRRGEIRRIQVSARELRRYQRPFEREPGWRTQGVTYGLVGPLQRDPELTFLDDAVLIGSFGGHGDRVYVYLFNLRGEDHEMQVASDGAILDDVILR